MVDTAVGFPKSREDMFEFYEFIRKGSHDTATKEGELEFPAGLHVQERAQVGVRRHGRPGRDALPRAPTPRHHPGDRRRRGRGRAARGARPPRPLLRRASASTRTRAWTRSARSTATRTSSTSSAVGAFPAGLYPQVALNDKKFYPDLREVHRGRRHVLLDRRRARAAPAVRAAGGRAHRRGLLVLPRAEVRHAPRLRTVDRARGEADAQVAEPLLLDHRVRAEALPERHHQLREHARRRQGDVLGLLPRRAQLRPHLHRDARRAVPRPRVAEVPARERATRLQAPREEGADR